jgi:hypothetical protein
MKDIILKNISENPGIKASELVVKMMNYVSEQKLQTNFDFINVIEELIHDGYIIEVQYILPDMDYRIKSMYFPKGTNIFNNERI